MQNIVPQKPEIEDPKNWKVKRDFALRFIKFGILLLFVSAWCFLGLWPAAVESEYLTMISWVLGLLGGIIFLVGLVKLPKVKYPPSSVIR